MSRLWCFVPFAVLVALVPACTKRPAPEPAPEPEPVLPTIVVQPADDGSIPPPRELPFRAAPAEDDTIPPPREVVRPAEDGTPAHEGRKLFLKLQCAVCHSATPTAKGPVLEALYGTRVALKGGGAVLADDAYIIDSIRKPKLHVVEGWEPVMPAYGDDKVTAEELNALVAYLRALKRGELKKDGGSPAPVGGPSEPPRPPK